FAPWLNSKIVFILCPSSTCLVSSQAEGCIYLVLEFCAGGNLASYIQLHGRLEEEIARKIHAATCIYFKIGWHVTPLTFFRSWFEGAKCPSYHSPRFKTRVFAVIFVLTLLVS
ncbi:unnamed protein product, partial [Thlaspi arvense]